MKRILTVIAGLFILYAAQGQELQKEVVYFDSNKDNLKLPEQQKIDKFLTELGDLTKLRFGIYGYTDSRGSMEYNLALSQRRSETVLRYLLDKGISVDNAIIDHFGELSPIVKEEENAKDMAHNRRVEIKAFEIDLPVVTANNPLGFKEHPLVKPILPHLTKKREVFSIDAGEEVTLNTGNGTTITIPANALVDAQGNPVEGKVDISYRDYLEPMDILLSGIPMTFDSGGVVNQFQTAGMFELEAAQGGRQVFLKDGEKINIDLQSVDSVGDYNFYALNDSAGWQNIGTAPVSNVFASSNWWGANYPSEAYRYYATGQGWRDRFLAELDSAEFNKLFNDEQYYYTHLQADMGDLKANYKFRSGKRDVKVRSYGYLKVRTVRRVRGDAKDVVRFTVQQKTTPKSHPEMRAFRDTYWKFAVNMDRKEFRKTFSYRKKYNDMRVLHNEGEEIATVQLKGNDGIISFEVYPYQPDMGQETMAAEDFDLQYARYEKLLAKRGKKFDKGVARKNAKVMRQHDKSLAEFNKRLQKLMTKEEQAMEFDEWVSYSKEQMKLLNGNMDAAKANNFTLTRSLAVDGFGIYNCDQIYRLKSPVEIIARYNDKDEETEVPWQTTYVIDGAMRGVLTYGNFMGKSGKITFDPKTVQAMVICNKDGELSFIRRSQMDDYYRNKKSYEFDVKAVSSVTSISELKAMLGLIN